MRSTPLMILTLLVLSAATALAVSEQEPNDEPLTPEGDPNPEYKGDIGEVGEIPVLVEGTVAHYGTVGVDADLDYHRITLTEDRRLSITLHGYQGNPNLVLFDEDLQGVPPDEPLVKGEGVLRYPMQTFAAGVYYLGMAGTEGPDDDPYTLSIRPGVDGSLTIVKARVKLNAKKPDRESAKIVAELGAVPPDPTKDGLLLGLRGRVWAFAPDAFTEKKGRHRMKGPKGAPVRKVLIDTVKSRLIVVVKKTDLGMPGIDEEIDLAVEAGGSRFSDTITEPIVKKAGRLLKYKAPK